MILLILSTIFPSMSIEYRPSADQVTKEQTPACMQTETLMYSRRYTTFSSYKQYTVMWQALWLSPSPEWARPYVEDSERKLRDVGVFGTSFKSREEIEKFQRQHFLSSCFTFQSELFPKFVF